MPPGTNPQFNGVLSPDEMTKCPAVVIQGVRQSDARCVDRGLAGRRRKGMKTNTRQSAQPRTSKNYLSYQTATTHTCSNDNNHDSGHDPHTHTCVRMFLLRQAMCDKDINLADPTHNGDGMVTLRVVKFQKGYVS